MGLPEVPIDVDPATGIWRTDGLAMVYLPRHFLVNNHRAAEEALGFEAYRRILRTATDKSAQHWCRSTAASQGLSPDATFRRYFQRLSQRGWGLFSVDMLDAGGRRAQISLRHSIFALEAGGGAGRPVCYMFEGFVIGALRHLMGEAGATSQILCGETQCAAAGGHDQCRFEAEARAN
jgi:predicted hydrocarbon binding protein